ncbi:glycine-rich domain-containing protein [Komagataeibacter rhaeticus]|uniref:glycine-rich domain-containing protein n=1 Tax=Komagataeibacter rhaeticus TaxID=215221 RepID=UPI002492712B|nr:hypothetical protein [Komagataeibacter rhaeticus]
MELIIGTGTVVEASRDTMPATGTPGWATDGDPASSIPATDFPASHYNMTVAEMVQVILDAGLTLDRTNWGQLSAAIQKLIAKPFGGTIFTPIQQGGGTDQGSNKVYLGWEIINDLSTGRLRYQIDTDDIGALANYSDVTALQDKIGDLTTAWGYTLSSSSIVVPAWATSMEIEAVGSGGGGGGCQGSSAAETVSGGGGASGGYMKAIYPVAGGDTLGITIGAGGGGGEGALPGNEGGTTVVSLNGAELFYIPGGGGSGKPTTANTAGGGGSMPVVVTPATAAYYTCGNSGSDGQAGNWVFAGNGAPSVYGGAGRAGNNGGQPATSPGAGGGGVYDSGMTGVAYDGGAGGVACVIYRFIP